MSVACAADRRYAMPLAVMLYSLDAALDPSFGLEIHAVDDGLDANDRERIAAALSPRVRVCWIRPHATGLGTLPSWGRMPGTTYQKLTLSDWLPRELERVIWLDCDLLVRTDLSSLWRAELRGQPLAAAQDFLVPTLASRFGVAGRRELGLPSEAKYFNAGVLLVDLAAWRAADIGRRAIDYVARFGDHLAFWDQEALNAACAGAWIELDKRWNWNETLAPHLALGKARALGIAPAPGEPWIVHFCGRLKPWRVADLGGFQGEFFSQLDATPWTGTRPERSLARAVAARYARSRVRRWLLPLEQWATALQLALTRRARAEPTAPR